MVNDMKGNVLTLDLDGHEPAPARPVKPASEPRSLYASPAPDFTNAPENAPPHDLTDDPFGWEEDAGRWILDHGPAPEPVPQTRPTQAQTAVFYIDADNQSAQSAADLVALFRDDLGVRELRAVIAGNNSGRQIQLWADELAAAAPGIETIALDCPSRKDAADLALIMELGANLAEHARCGDLVAIVSRDDLLVGAAERTKAQGCRAMATAMANSKLLLAAVNDSVAVFA